ncbi:MAG: TolC family protein [Rhodothermales bacterium]
MFVPRTRPFAALLFAFVVLTAPVGAQSPTPRLEADLPLLRLDELVEEVRASNPSLRAAHLEVEALSTVARQVSALPDPMIMGTYQPFSVLTARGAQRSQWRIEQQLPYPGKLSLKGDIADLGTDVAAHEATAFEIDLVASVKRVYYELYRIQEQLVLINIFQDRLVQFEAAAAEQYQVGTGMQQAILKAQIEKNALSQRALDLEERRTTAVETLSRLVDRPIEGEFRVEISQPEIDGLQAAELVDTALRNRPEMKAVESAAERADKQIDLAHKQFLPDFGVNVTYFDIASGPVPPTATGRDAIALGISIKVPLQRDRLRARLEEAKARRSQTDARRDALASSFRTQIHDLVKRLEIETEQLDLYRDLLIPQATSTVNAILSAYTTGRTDFLNLLDAERMLFTLRLNREDAQARLLKASADLERELAVDNLSDLSTF